MSNHCRKRFYHEKNCLFISRRVNITVVCLRNLYNGSIRTNTQYLCRLYGTTAHLPVGCSRPRFQERRRHVFRLQTNGNVLCSRNALRLSARLLRLARFSLLLTLCQLAGILRSLFLHDHVHSQKRQSRPLAMAGQRLQGSRAKNQINFLPREQTRSI